VGIWLKCGWILCFCNCEGEKTGGISLGNDGKSERKCQGNDGDADE
jgi:hypothetical protein